MVNPFCYLNCSISIYLLTVHGAEISDVVRAVASGRVLLDERTVTRRRADHDDPTAELTNAERKARRPSLARIPRRGRAWPW